MYTYSKLFKQYIFFHLLFETITINTIKIIIMDL